MNKEEDMVQIHKILKIKLKTPLAEKIAGCINSIYVQNISIPVFSKFIIDRTCTLNQPFENYVNNLKGISISIPYLFSEHFKSTSNLGIKLQIVSDGFEHIYTYDDLVLFVFDDETGKINIVKNPPGSKYHMIGIESANTNLTDKERDEYKSQGYILLFSSTAKIEDNYNLHDELLKTFPDYPMNSIKDEIENSRQIYEYNMVNGQLPFNMWIINNEDGTYLNIRINHYLDINKTIIKDYLLDIFKTIYDIFFTTSDNIYQEIINYKKELEFNDIQNHELNYDIIKIQNNVDKKIFDAICYSNNIPGTNGYYLKPRSDEIIQTDKLVDFFRNEIQYICEEITNHFDQIKYLHN